MLLTQTVNVIKQTQRRQLFHWVNKMFNSVDDDRRRTLGPDRVCAEWILRNGGAVKFVNDKEFLSDYNTLPDEEIKVYIAEVDATGSSIMHYGFPHFNGCRFIKKIIFHKCNYLENEAIKELVYVKDTLEHLQISSSANITEKGLKYLEDYNKLKSLIVFDLPYLQGKEKISEDLKKALPNCNVLFK